MINIDWTKLHTHQIQQYKFSIDGTDFLSIEQIFYRKNRFSINRKSVLLIENLAYRQKIWPYEAGKMESNIFEEINVYFVMVTYLKNWLFALEASRIAIQNIKHDQLDTDLQDYALT